MDTTLILLFFGMFFALAWRKVEYGVVFLVVTLPLYVVRFSVFGLPSTFLEGMVFILFCTWFIKQRHELWKERKTLLEYKFLMGAIFLFLTASLISIYIAPHTYKALGLWRAYILEPILFFLVFTHTIRTKKQIVWVCVASVLSGCSIALYGIFQKITGFGIPEPWMIERRITSIFPYPNAVGLYLAPIVVISITFLIWHISTHARGAKKNAITLLLVVVIGILFSGIFFAKTEAAFAALVVSGLLFGFFWSARSLRASLLVSVFVVFFVFISPPLANTFQEKLFLKDWSGAVRKSIWKETTPMVRDNWALGAGFSGYQEKMKLYHKDTFIEIFQYPHNVVLNFWSEMGLLGLIAFEMIAGWYVFILGRVLFILRKVPQGSEKNWMRIAAFGGLCIMSTILVHGLVDVPYFKNDLSVFFWMLIGLAIAMYTNTKELNVHT